MNLAEIKQNVDNITIKISKENHTLEDLEQKAIEYLYDSFKNSKAINENDIKLFEILKKTR